MAVVAVGLIALKALGMVVLASLEGLAAVAYMTMLSSVEALIRLAAVEGLALLQPRSPQQLEIASLLPPPMLSPQQLEIESLLSQKK